MQGKPLWMLLAGVWALAGLVAGLLMLGPADPKPAAKPTEMQVLEATAESPTKPLDAPETGPALDPVIREQAPETVHDLPPEIQPEPPKPESTSSRPSVVIQPADKSSRPASYRDVRIEAGGVLTLPEGETSVDGNWNNLGTVNAATSTVVFDGADQTLEGSLTAKKIVLRGGTKRIRGSFGTNGSENAEPGKAGLYVEAGTTLIIEKGGKWTTPNPYGFQVAGNLVIEGGEFHCRFSNGNGTDRGEESWLAGSTLTIHSGKFVGNGDADFSGCAITIHEGSLEINDDIWNSGDSLTMLGGLMRNTKSGGMFYLTGTVSVSAGKLDVYQNNSRSLRFAKDASVYCTGGEISINGSPATAADGGILLASSATVPNLVINTDTKIHKDSLTTAYLSVSGDMSIARGHKFEAQGFNVLASIPAGPETGEFIP